MNCIYANICFTRENDKHYWNLKVKLGAEGRAPHISEAANALSLWSQGVCDAAYHPLKAVVTQISLDGSLNGEPSHIIGMSFPEADVKEEGGFLNFINKPLSS